MPPADLSGRGIKRLKATINDCVYVTPWRMAKIGADTNIVTFFSLPAETHKFIHVKSLSLKGRIPLFDLIPLFNIHLPIRRGKLTLFWPHLLPIIFQLILLNFPMKMLCLVNKVSTKYKDEMCLHHVMSCKLLKGGNIFHVNKYNWNLNVLWQNKCCGTVLHRISLFGKMQRGRSPSFELFQLDMYASWWGTLSTYNLSV